MNKICKKVQILLSLYIEDALENQEKKMVASHLSDCMECQHQLKLMQKTIDNLHQLEKINAPQDFLINVQQRVSAQSFWQTLKKIIFFPFYIQSPAPFASILAVLVLVVFLQKTGLHNKVTIDSMKDIKTGADLNKTHRYKKQKEAAITSERSSAMIQDVSKSIISKTSKRKRVFIFAYKKSFSKET